MKRIVVFLSADFAQGYLDSTGVSFPDTLFKFLASNFKEENVKFVYRDEYNFQLDVNDKEAEVDANSLLGGIIEQLSLQEFIGSALNISCYSYTPEVAFTVFGKKKKNSKFAESIRRYHDLSKYLQSVIFGQDYAINRIVNGLLEANTFKRVNPHRPKVTFFIAGPQKTGKSALAEHVTNYLGMPTLELFSTDYRDQRTITRLATFINKHPNGAIIFNDCEDFNLDLARILYSAYTTGEVEGIVFRDLTIFFTTRCGRSLYENSPRKNLSHLQSRDIIDACLRDTDAFDGHSFFNPYFLKAIENENIIMLNHLQSVNYQLILSSYIEKYVNAFFENTGIALEVDAFTLAQFVLFNDPIEKDIGKLKKTTDEILNEEIEYLIKQVDKNNEPLLLGINKIKLVVDLTKAKKEVKELFNSRTYNVAVACSDEEMKILSTMNKGDYNLIQVKSILELKTQYKEGIDLLLVDPLMEIRDKVLPIDIEDYDSVGMDIFDYANKYYGRTPLDIISNLKYEKNASSYQTLANRGINTLIFYKEDDLSDLENNIYTSLLSFELERDIEQLSRDNVYLSYNAKHVIKENEVEVRLTKLVLVPVEIYEYNGDNSRLRRIKGFKDVIGCDVAKKSFIHYSKYLSSTPEYLQSGMLPPKLLLVNGYPGVGKTTLVKALSEETSSTIINIDGKKIIIDRQNYVDAIHEAFKKARYASPAIIHFTNINVIISYGESVDNIRMLEALEEEISYSVKDDLHPIIIVGECDPNYPVNEKLKENATRYFIIPRPNIEECEAFIKRYLEDKHIDTISEKGIHNYALRNARSTFVEIERALDFAINYAQEKGLNDKTLKESLDALVFGDISNLKHDDEEVLATSYHEIGHYLLMRLFDQKSPFVTIVARANFGGYTAFETTDFIETETKQNLLDNICISFSGRAAEIIFRGEEIGTTTGISGDIMQATNVAKIMITRCAMGKKLAAYRENEVIYNSKEIYDEVNEILDEQFKRAVSLLSRNKENLILLSEALFKNKSMTGDELEELLPDDKLIKE